MRIVINFQQVNPTFDVTDTQTPDPPVVEITSSLAFGTLVSCLLRKKEWEESLASLAYTKHVNGNFFFFLVCMNKIVFKKLSIVQSLVF